MTKTTVSDAADGRAEGKEHAVTVRQIDWGRAQSGEPVQLFTLTGGEITVRITNFGAHVVSIEAPDRKGSKANVVLGYNDLAGYEADIQSYTGAVVGRYGNRIANGSFALEGKKFHIPQNNGPNALHGGPAGFDRKVWSASVIPDGVEMTLVSPDGDMGFPGKLTACVRYTVVAASLHIDYSASSDKPTVVNLTNHSYFNLSGEGTGTILDHKLTLNADRFTPIDKNLIPTGQLASVEQTPLDFRHAAAIGTRIDEAYEQMELAGGYDHNFVLGGGNGTPSVAAKVTDPASGRTLTVSTTEPGVQFYSGNFLNGSLKGASGKAYGKHSGFCLETQHFPDSPNKPGFPSTVLKPGETMHSSTVFAFSVEQ